MKAECQSIIQRGTELINAHPPLKRTGLHLVSININTATFRMPLVGNSNHVNTMHAASLFTLAEAAAGILFLNRFEPDYIAPVCANVNIRFRRPANSDVDLTISITDSQYASLEEEACRRGKANFDIKAELTDKDGVVISIAEINYVLLRC